MKKLIDKKWILLLMTCFFAILAVCLINSETKKEDSDNVPVQNFFKFDWTADEVLMRHSIEPEDSGQGWEFIIADMDFDEIPEMLVMFPANHCGKNSMYIYKQRSEAVFSYADIIAVLDKHILSDIDYKEISSYLDIKFLDAYVNSDNELKYLSLDYDLYGGNEKGGIGTLILYETTFKDKIQSKELLKISYNCPEEKTEIFFQGNRVYETEKLSDMLSEYMKDYSKVNIEYEIIDKSFPRDITGMDEAGKKQELEELYDAIRKTVN